MTYQKMFSPLKRQIFSEKEAKLSNLFPFGKNFPRVTITSSTYNINTPLDPPSSIDNVMISTKKIYLFYTHLNAFCVYSNNHYDD